MSASSTKTLCGVRSRSELNELVNSLYQRVRRISAAEMGKAFDQPLDSLTLQPTAIANDAIMRVLQQRASVVSADHFFALATQFIRQLIVDYQRHRSAAKRGGGDRGLALDRAAELPAATLPPGETDARVLELLDHLHEQYPRKAEVVCLHAVCGHSLREVADLLELSLATIERDWTFAKAWLAPRLRAGAAE